jgi:hypothetical protein
MSRVAWVACQKLGPSPTSPPGRAPPRPVACRGPSTHILIGGGVARYGRQGTLDRRVRLTGTFHDFDAINLVRLPTHFSQHSSCERLANTRWCRYIQELYTSDRRSQSVRVGGASACSRCGCRILRTTSWPSGTGESRWRIDLHTRLCLVWVAVPGIRPRARGSTHSQLSTRNRRGRPGAAATAKRAATNRRRSLSPGSRGQRSFNFPTEP